MFADVIVSLLATVARQESVRRSERASAAYARLKAVGKTDHLGRKRLVVDRSKVQAMHEAGMSVREIARKVGIGHASVHRMLRAIA
jgi:DNA invertase Pin-like site-specific DNA recombinase